MGWYIHQADKPFETAKNITKTQVDVTSNTKQYLVIKEWGVKLKLAAVINDANYQITNEKKISDSEVPVVRLSTK